MLTILRDPNPRTALRPALPTSLGSRALSPLENETLAHLLNDARPAAMNLEWLDGLYCALIASPGGQRRDAGGPYAASATRLLARHWDSIIADFDQDGFHVPVILEPYVDGIAGRAWARGFMQGVGAAAAEWHALFSDENEGYLISIPLIAGEIDAAWPRASLSDKKIDEFLTWMSAGAARAYRRFADARGQQALACRGERSVQGDHAVARAGAASDNAEVSAATDPKIGRMALCPCGSHRKYKRCCGEFRTR